VHDLDQFKQTYFQECEELLGDMEGHLMALDEGSGDVEGLHAIFRAVHSIKGGAGAFGFEQLVAFAHILETVLDHMRDGEIEATPEVVAILLRAGDVLADFVRAARAEERLDEEYGKDVLEQLKQLAGEKGDDGGADFDIEFMPVAVSFDDDGSVADEAPAAAEAPIAELGDWQPVAVSETHRWHIRVTPFPDMLTKGNEPLLLFRELNALGSASVVADLSAVPPLDSILATTAYLTWDIEVETDKGLDAIEEIFEFVRDDCQLQIGPAGVPLPPPASAEAEAEAAPPPPPPKAEPAFTLTPDMFGQSAEAVIETPAAPPPPPPPAAPPAAAKPAAKTTAEAPAQPTAMSMRVDLDKVDRLVNMVGELVITQAMLSQLGSQVATDKYPELSRGLEELQHHTRELQESVMAIRAQPIKSVFQRVPRMVRELASQLDKQIRLVTSGENTEIDKTVIENLSDPLTHLIRNACDHGLETPEERIEQGKPAEGTIWLSAEHRGGRICIEITEDGRGINRKRVYEKAVEKGLIPRGTALTDEETDNIIFLPGFSTAATISNVSGRGVGLDVVKRNIQGLGGRISVTSTEGKGSTFLLTLPLTLAVLDGMIVQVGGQTYVLPLTNIIECLRPAASELHSVVNSGEVLYLRGEYVPMIYLHRLFSVEGAITDPTKSVIVVVENEDGAKIGLIVDELLGQQQVVIKSLESNYDPVEGIAAATILGDGRVALILDIAGLREMTRAAPSAAMLGHNRPPKAIAMNGGL